jgi:branched-chain amino acid transport system permease protein
MSGLEQILFVGLVQGAIFGLVGLTFTALYNAAKLINLAQGDFTMIGAVVVAAAVAGGVAPIAAVPIALAVGLIAAAAFFVVIRIQERRHAPPVTILLSTVGIGLTLQGVVGGLTGFSYQQLSPAFLEAGSLYTVGALVIRPEQLLVLATTGVLVVGFWYVQTRTLWGVALRAVGNNPTMAQLCGISTTRMVLLATMLSLAMATTAGIVYAPIIPAIATMGFALLINGFIAAVFGGIGNPYAALVGGLVLGLTRTLAAGYVHSGFAELASLVILLGVLLFRPQGLFGASE